MVWLMMKTNKTSSVSSPVAKVGIKKIRAHMLSGEAASLPPVSIALNSNESAFGPSPHAVAAARAAVSGLERYYENPAKTLVPALAGTFGLDEQRIAIGQGSDDLLARLARAYLEPGSELIRSVNGYLKVPNYAHANDAIPVPAPDAGFTASVDAILGCLSDRTRMVYLANPENPAGTYLSGAEIRRLHAGLPDHILLVLDCAYEDYVDAADYEPAHRLVEEAGNVVMTRTFSKIFGLAGARIGWLYGPPPIVDVINRIGLTFPLSSPSIAASIAALQDKNHIRHVFETNARMRDKLTRSLTALGLKVYPSQTNFLLVEFTHPAFSAEAADAFLRRRGIALRRVASPAYRDCIRMTLGLESEVETAEHAISAFLKEETDA